jgi:hypothetical protein
MADVSGPRFSCLLGCSKNAEGAACALLEAATDGLSLTASPQQRRWYSVLAELQSSEAPSAPPEKDVEFVALLLREALQCVQGDEQWNCSGIAQMLQR